MKPEQDITVVIRSVGERTELLCKKFVLTQGVPEENVFMIHEKPFSKAMKAGYQAGFEKGNVWT